MDTFVRVWPETSRWRSRLWCLRRSSKTCTTRRLPSWKRFGTRRRPRSEPKRRRTAPERFETPSARWTPLKPRSWSTSRNVLPSTVKDNRFFFFFKNYTFNSHGVDLVFVCTRTCLNIRSSFPSVSFESQYFFLASSVKQILTTRFEHRNNQHQRQLIVIEIDWTTTVII